MNNSLCVTFIEIVIHEACSMCNVHVFKIKFGL